MIDITNIEVHLTALEAAIEHAQVVLRGWANNEDRSDDSYLIEVGLTLEHAMKIIKEVNKNEA